MNNEALIEMSKQIIRIASDNKRSTNEVVKVLKLLAGGYSAKGEATVKYSDEFNKWT